MYQPKVEADFERNEGRIAFGMFLKRVSPYDLAAIKAFRESNEYASARAAFRRRVNGGA